MTTAPLPDAAERLRALDPTRSFLVQAPAGAGKTELLIQRFLRLLAGVDEPEEVVAITFTRKAAAEMRVRLGRALASAAGGQGTMSAHEAQTRSLAAAALDRSAARGWNLEAHPARLRIATIDAFNSRIARGAPLAGTDAYRNLVQGSAAAQRYREAARDTIRLLGSGEPVSGALEALLLHLDNRPDELERLLAEMLSCRDQWLPAISGIADWRAVRIQLESALHRVIGERIERIERAVGAPLVAAAHAAAAAAAEHLDDALDWQMATAPLPLRARRWRAVARLLTKEGGRALRAQFTRRDGCPPNSDAKRRAEALAASLAGRDDIVAALGSAAALPTPVYSDQQWQALQGFLEVLPVAAAMLRLAFAAHGETDYIAIAGAAAAAIGDDSDPGEAGLRLDRRIRHLLVDEFQDTSRRQYDLLRALTNGWSLGDGRTVFLVGDPMQSVYRFRQAEVSLFLAVRDGGLPGVPVEFLRLQANFRSTPILVGWVNNVFGRVLPPEDDPLESAISLAPALAVRPQSTDSWVRLAQPLNEAQAICGVVSQCVRDYPDDSLAILVRSRTHATPILAELRAAGIDADAGRLRRPARTAVASDLLAIVRVVCHRADRLAWLALLRSPLCGLTLGDLAQLAEADSRTLLPTLLADPAAVARLSPDGRERVERVLAVLSCAFDRRGRVPLRDLVEGIWTELGGPATAGPELIHADAVLDRIAAHDDGGDCADVLTLADDLDEPGTEAEDSTARVQIMTMHAAKGLEFDTVILAQLGAVQRRDSKPALIWQDLPTRSGHAALLLAPIKAAEQDADELYDFLWELQRAQQRAEYDRLLYVAATRARKRLLLTGRTADSTVRDEAAEESSEPGDTKPRAGSLLARLWPALAASWPAAAGDAAVGRVERWVSPGLYRLPTHWRPPVAPVPLTITTRAAELARPATPFDWSRPWTLHVGTVVHQCLAQIGRTGCERLTSRELRQLFEAIPVLLVRSGIDSTDLGRGVERAREALRLSLADPVAKWILSGEHPEHASEQALTMARDGLTERIVIDRTFVTAEGERWIVDFKTGIHEGGNLERFLQSEAERYSPQLSRYRAALGRLDRRPIRTALYFPLQSVMQEVVAESDRTAA